MADIRTLKKAIDFASENYANPTDNKKRDKAALFAKKFDLTDADLNSYKNAFILPPKESNIIKGRVIDKVAGKSYGGDDGSPVGIGERFLIKNLIDEDPDLQVKYLERKGYKARISNGELEAARPGEFFQKVDPSEFEYGDFLDVVGDTLQGAIVGGLTAAGVVSSVATGGLSVPVSLGVGAAASSGLEAVKQGIAKGVGLREDYNIPRMAEKGLIGGISSILPSVLGRGAENMATNLKSPPKANVAELKRISGEMGATPTPGMLSSNPSIQKLEDARYEAPPTWFNRDLQNQVKQNIDATDTYADKFMSGRVDIPQTEAAAQIQSSIGEKLQAKLGNAEELYKNIGENLNRTGYRVDPSPLQTTIDTLESGFKFSKTGKSWIKERTADLAEVKSVEDLRLLKTDLSNDVARFKFPTPNYRALR